MKHEKYSKITNPAEALKNIGDINEELRKYWYRDSKLARALEDYIWKDPDCHLVERIGREVVEYRAHSGVNLMRVHVTRHFGPPPIPKPQLVFDFNVELVNEELEDSSTVRVQAILPASMELMFSPAKFAQWIAEGKKERGRHPNRKDIETIIRIGMKHNIRPSMIDQFLRWIKGSKNE